MSIWEFVLLVEKNKIRITADLGEWVDGSIADLQLQEAPFSSSVAHELRSTQLPHRDPGDRFLIATARVYSLTLVTSDANVLNIPNVSIFHNKT